jgi:hypothetical protein
LVSVDAVLDSPVSWNASRFNEIVVVP